MAMVTGHKPAQEVVSLRVLWRGVYMGDGRDYVRDYVRVIGEADGKLTLLNDQHEIMDGVPAEQVLRYGRFDVDDDPDKLSAAPICGDCGHFFDPSDARAFIPRNDDKYPDLRPSCPACHTLAMGGEAWALWNPCQGVFTCGVFHSRKEAEAARDDDPDCYEKVVPVRVIVEPKQEHDHRRWLEDDREALKTAPEPAP